MDESFGQSRIGEEISGVPRICQLAAESAPVADILTELQSVQSDTKEGKQALWWGLKSISGREGDSSIQDGDLVRIEESLTDDRFGKIVDIRPGDHDIDYLAQVHTYAVEKGFTEKDFCFDYNDSQLSGKDLLKMSGAELHTAQRKNFFSGGMTFGSNEPDYIEILGPDEIIRLRLLERPPVFLLLGSLGRLSVMDANVFVKKIRPDSRLLTIDISEPSIFDIHNAVAEGLVDAGRIVRGDVTCLPFKSDTIDVCMTNILFKKFDTDGKGGASLSVTKNNIGDLANEMFRVLNKEGTLLAVECGRKSLYSERIKKEASFGEEIDKILLKANLKKINQANRSLSIPMNCQIGKPQITPYGFGDYSDICLVSSMEPGYVVKYGKK